MSVTLPLPDPFSFKLTIQFLQRSPKELLHRTLDDRVIKLLPVGKELVLFSVREGNDKLIIDFLNGDTSNAAKAEIKDYVREWFDLETDLIPFYALARKDELLKNLVREYSGYRIIGQPDLFESLVWAVLGQQINLNFAYTLKQRFVELFGKNVEIEGHRYFAFPTPEVVEQLTDADLLPLQFSRQKSKYVRLIAEAFVNGEVSKSKLSGMPLQAAKDHLIKIKGVGNWTANYALMKTFRYPDAFPLEDVALHKAIMIGKGLKARPSLDQVKRIFKKYRGWEAYATLYLWKSL
jgi:DNA-3-methyladenine glycosylase II